MTQDFHNVTAVAKANVYFGGKVLSHTLLFPGGSKKTLGLIFPGEYRFDTGLKEGMEMTAGACRVRLKGHEGWTAYKAGDVFEIPGQSYFDIAVDEGIAEYICSFG